MERPSRAAGDVLLPPTITPRMEISPPSLADTLAIDEVKGSPAQAEDWSLRLSLTTGFQGGSAKPAFPIVPDFECHGLVGQGGMGAVYRGRDLAFDRELAVKVMLDGASKERFLEEARICGQLQHPNIVPVHRLGTLPDGRPYFTMKLVHGETLADLLRAKRKRERKGEASAPADLPRLLKAFEQLAQGMAYAHQQRFLHRDLKPSNVMVGQFGELQIMDWGLAKRLGGGEKPSEGQRAPEMAGELQMLAVGWSYSNGEGPTQVGTVLGTPTYMAPEQARGEIDQMDARVDVFALGAILCELLTGYPPYGPAEMQEALAKAQQGDVSHGMHALDRCGADAELVALAKDCLTPRREERPRDAGVVAERMTAYLLGVQEKLKQAEVAQAAAAAKAGEALAKARAQRRATRLAYAVAAVTLVGLLAAAALVWWAVRAEQQTRLERDARELAWRQAAVERDAKAKALSAETLARQKAMTALRTLTDEIVENQMARAGTLTPENRAFLRKIIDLFEGVANLTGDDAQNRAIRAEGSARVGLMRHRLGELAGAEAAMRSARDQFRQLATEFPERPEYQRELGSICNNLGLLLSSTGRLNEAEETLRGARASFHKLAEEFPSRPEYLQGLAASHLNLSTMLHQTGRLKEAVEACRSASDLQAKLAADFPTRPEFRSQLASSQNSLGALLRESGRADEAEKAFRAAREVRHKLAEEFPTRSEFRRELAQSENNLGALLRERGQLQAAESAHRRALNLQVRLAAEFPGRPELRRELAGSHDNLGIVHVSCGKWNEAKEEFRAARELKQRLAADFPNQPAIRNELGATCVNLALAYQKLGDLEAARQTLNEGRPHLLAALNASPNHPTFRQFYRNCLTLLAAVHAGLLEPDEAFRSVQTLRDVGWDPPADAYAAAALLCRCIPLLEKHEKLAVEERRSAVQAYATEAMKLLRHAVQKGYRDGPRLKQDPSFAPLHARDDFKKLLTELGAKE